MTWDNRLTFEVSSADPDSPTPVWVDLTTRIRDAIQPVTTQSGRQNDLDQSEPGRLDALLDNSDDALTYGNTASPYPWWGPGRKCRLRETVAGVVMDRFSGYLQVPTEVLITAPVDPADPHEQRVAITATDRLGRLASGEPFVSTLGQHILYNGGAGLKGYWTYARAPMADVSPNNAPAAIVQNYYVSNVVPEAGGPSISFGSRSVVADDLPVLTMTAATGKSAGVDVVTSAPNIWINRSGAPWSVTSGQAVTLVGWFNPALPANPGNAAPFVLYMASGETIAINVTSTGALFVQCTGALTGSATNGYLPNDHWSPIGLRYDSTASSVELWLGTTRYTTALAGVPPASDTITNIQAPFGYAGSLGHIQLYIGSSWGYTDYLAQVQMGLTGLERQTTGDRIRTIAQYAGVPASELTQIDKGTSVMQRATLAGKDPLSAMRDAERTEQGLLYVDGSGNLIFKDRRTLYNI